MEINIDGKYYLSANQNCWTVKELVGECTRGGKKEKKWNYIGYYQLPGNAIKCLARHEIMTSDAKTFAEAIKKIEEIQEKYDNVLSAIFTTDDLNKLDRKLGKKS